MLRHVEQIYELYYISDGYVLLIDNSYMVNKMSISEPLAIVQSKFVSGETVVTVSFSELDSGYILSL